MARKTENDEKLVSSSNRLKMLTPITNNSHYKTSYLTTSNTINNSSSPPLTTNQRRRRRRHYLMANNSEKVRGSSWQWTNERHVSFLNSMEASFVHSMLENNVNGRDTTNVPPLDRYLPDISDSTRDLGRDRRTRLTFLSGNFIINKLFNHIHVHYYLCSNLFSNHI